MKKIFILTMAFFMGLTASAQQNVAKLAQRGDVNACLTLAKEDITNYRFEEAEEWLAKAETTLKKKKQKSDELEQLRAEAARGLRMLRGTDQVLFIDSVVVDKADFLEVYKLSEETGSLDSYAWKTGASVSAPVTSWPMEPGAVHMR